MVNTGTVVVDVSVVVRSADLGPAPSLDHLDVVLSAWKQQIEAFPEFLLIADRSLRPLLPDHERRGLERRLHASGDYRVVRFADRVILESAARRGAAVVTRDQYVDHYDEFPWVRTEPERFFAWQFDETDVVIVPRTRVSFPDYDVSQRAERTQLRARGFSGKPREHPELWARYRCPSDGCIAQSVSPGVLRVLPLWQDGSARCPSCSGALERLEQAPWAVELKLEFDGRVVHRFSVVDGEPTVLGRNTLPSTDELRELGEAGRLRQLGRQHLRFELKGQTLVVHDLGSVAGTTISRWDGRKRGLDRRTQRMAQDRPANLGARDVLSIGSKIRVLRSGRSIAEAEALGKADATGPWRGDVTAPGTCSEP